ncbi:hypothetical protein Bhyg_04040, partial [Pseudolycoriella hygida]
RRKWQQRSTKTTEVEKYGVLVGECNHGLPIRKMNNTNGRGSNSQPLQVRHMASLLEVGTRDFLLIPVALAQTQNAALEKTMARPPMQNNSFPDLSQSDCDQSTTDQSTSDKSTNEQSTSDQSTSDQFSSKLTSSTSNASSKESAEKIFAKLHKRFVRRRIC